MDPFTIGMVATQVGSAVAGGMGGAAKKNAQPELTAEESQRDRLRRERQAARERRGVEGGVAAEQVAPDGEEPEEKEEGYFSNFWRDDPGKQAIHDLTRMVARRALSKVAHKKIEGG